MNESGWKATMAPRLKAAGIHLSGSAVLFAVILYFILFEWYPEPFFTAQGGWQGIRLMAFVDLVLGPTLTLIVFNHLKERREILLDLGLILAVQLAALVWGGYQVYTQRPLAMVFWVDGFYTVTQDDYLSQGVAIPDFSRYSRHFPPLVYSRPPETVAEIEAAREKNRRLIPAYAQIDTYRAIDDHLQAVFFNEVDIAEVMEKNADMAQRLMAITGGRWQDYHYVALNAKYRNMILVMNEAGRIIGEVKARYHH